ncbi:hypothetical protein [uncultured Winogradskyella sp.]|uniref:hypothetical protein n=1 Tax=uncultured Winogradskyella sp. TaxID=395353 RepID=UPI0035114FFC
MKSILRIIVLISLFWSCKSQSASTEKIEHGTAIKNDTTQVMAVAKDNTNQDQENLAVVYSASSRGFFEYIKITESETILSEDRYLKSIRTYPTKSKDWEALVKFIDSTDYKKFKTLEAPTGKRLYDGAAHALLTIVDGKEELTTPSFDHGHPPKDILNFVAKVLSIREDLQKQ